MRGVNLKIMNDSCSILEQRGYDVTELYNKKSMGEAVIDEIKILKEKESDKKN